MYKYRFGEEAPERRSIDQLRGIEGARVRSMYQLLAKKYKVPWENRRYDPHEWNNADPINRTLSAANHALYGICKRQFWLPAMRPQSASFILANLSRSCTILVISSSSRPWFLLLFRSSVLAAKISSRCAIEMSGQLSRIAYFEEDNPNY